jgi:branched-chain amino acid transport system substrate-binding protein
LTAGILSAIIEERTADRDKGAYPMNPQHLIRRSSGRFFTMIVLMGLAGFCLSDCVAKESVRIGVVAQLTGVQADLGVQERNGVQLAVEEINAEGGIAGRRIELVVRDDLGTPEGARAADRELIDAGVVAIIGHATSGQTIAGLAVTNPARVVMLSPTATAPELSGREDYFFRICASLVERAQVMARHLHQGRHMTRVAVAYDVDNTAYAKSFRDAFAAMYQALGGTLVAEAEFSSKEQPDFAPLVARLRDSDPQGLLIIAADIDTALIAQRSRLMGWPIPLFASAWAQTETLVNNGGRAVEGLEIEIANPFHKQTPRYLEFKTRYQGRFGLVPSFGAVFGYEAAKVLAAALEKTGGKADGLSQALVGIKNFKGLSDSLSFDRYGDVIRPFYMGVIREGNLVDADTLKPTRP